MWRFVINSISSVRILLADDHPVMREGLASLIRQWEGMSVVAEACDGKEAVALFRQYQPDVTLLDMRMPIMNGLEALYTIRREFPQARIIVFSAFDMQDDIYRALQAGAKCYLLKESHPAELFDAIMQVAQGQTYFPAHILSQMAKRMCVPELTGREEEVLVLMAAGNSNNEIGGKLFIAEGTVKVHVANILKKMAVNDRTQAVTTAIKRGLIHVM